MKLSHAKYAKFEAFRTLYEREPAYRGQARDLIYLREPFSEIRIEKEDWDSSTAYGISLEVQGAAGGHIKEEIIPQILNLCKTLDHMVHAELNGTVMGVWQDDTVQTAIERWEALREAEAKAAEAKRKEYEASPEYAAAQAAAKAQQEAEDKRRQELLSLAPNGPTFTDPGGWEKTVENNTDPYGAATVSYANMWAQMMEGLINQGSALKDIAEECSYIADTDGITGFMYGCAVSILSHYWKYGSDLNAWHNDKYGDQGEEATKSGGTINPAVLTMTIGGRES
jgi:hypothetical protein